MDDNQKLTIETRMGTLIAYPSGDPNNPGIFIDLIRPGVPYRLNLSGTECRQGPEMDDPVLTTHAWGMADQEDTTHDIDHEGIDAYFDRQAGGMAPGKKA